MENLTEKSFLAGAKFFHKKDHTTEYFFLNENLYFCETWRWAIIKNYSLERWDNESFTIVLYAFETQTKHQIFYKDCFLK